MKKSKFKINPSELRIVYQILFAIAVLVMVFLFIPQPTDEAGRVTFPDGTSITVELAQSKVEQTLGLSGRESLDADHGMLFLFDGYRIPTFWMHKMEFSIDIIWLSDGQIVDFDENLPLDDTRYSPKAPVNQVLEVNAGFVKEHQLKIGDQLEIILP